MNRTKIVLAAGACVAIAGALLAVRAGALSTRWVTGEGMAVGFPDPALRQTYFTVGLVALCFGLALVGLAAWKWLKGEPGTPPQSRASV